MKDPLTVLIVEHRHAEQPEGAAVLGHYDPDFGERNARLSRELNAMETKLRPDIVLCAGEPAVDCMEFALDTLPLLGSRTPIIHLATVDETGTSPAGTGVARAPHPALHDEAGTRARLSSLLQSSADSCVISDSEGWISDANPSACRQLDRCCERSLGTLLIAPADDSLRCPHSLDAADDSQRRIDTFPIPPAKRSGAASRKRHHHTLAYFDSESGFPSLVHLSDLIDGTGERPQGNLAPLALIVKTNGGRKATTATRVHRLSDSSLPGEAPIASILPAPAPRPRRESRRRSEGKALPSAVSPASLEQLLGAAIHTGTLNVHYQPQYELESGRSCGVEALARWTLPTGEIVPPSVFIPIAEQTGLIHDLGASILNAACLATVAWERRTGRSMILAVNVSPLQINKHFHEVLIGALEVSGFPARQLELEITESALIANSDLVIEYLKDWKHLGVRIALDDFGAGYSSLSYLCRLPLDRLKLDSSLVHMMTRDSKSARVMRLIIELGKELEMDVIAEGVETEQQFQMLKDFNCPKVQGYLLARPMSEKLARIALNRRWGNRPAPRFRPARIAAEEEAHAH